MKILIVYAHPEPKSFNGSLRDLAVETLTGAGHEVRVSDLYAMEFNPVTGRHDFQEQANPEYFRIQNEQKHAAETGTFAPDLKAEMEKVVWADFLIFQFPLWWFGIPAILKGWVDRVFAVGFAYGGELGRYDQGVFRGKRAMVSVTTGGGPGTFAADGLSGHIDALLFPVQHGMLYYVGMDVLPPFIAWSASWAPAATKQSYLDEYRQRLLSLDSIEPLFFHPLSDYDEDFRLKPEARRP